MCFFFSVQIIIAFYDNFFSFSSLLCLNCQVQAFVGKHSIRKNGLCLCQEACFVSHARRVMPDDEFAYLCLAGNFSCLYGGAMEGLAGSELIVFPKRGFVEKQINTLYLSGKCWLGGCVAAIGIAARGRRLGSQSVIGYKCAVLECPIHTSLDVVNLTDGYLVHVYHVAQNVAWTLFLAEEIAAARYAMAKRKAPNLHRTVLMNDLMLGGINLVKQDLKLQIGTKQLQRTVEECLQFPWRVDM